MPEKPNDQASLHTQYPRQQSRVNEGRDNSNTTGVFADQVKSPSIELQVPQITLPKGGGAIKGIEEKFQVNAASGTCSFAIPIPISPSRNSFSPSIGLSYNSGSGNSAFGLGWNAGLGSISRKTEKKLPEYKDEDDSDIFILSGTEDLVPLLEKQSDGSWKVFEQPTRIENSITYTVKRYRPRIEGLFARIEKWENPLTGDTHWSTISRDNIHSYYGLTDESRIRDPKNETRIFEWLICRTHDDKGSIIIYNYKKEDFTNIPDRLSEKNRINNCTQRYLKEVWFGNKTPYYLRDTIPVKNDFLFRLIFDYGEHDKATDIPIDIDAEKNKWAYRKDPFSSYRSGFEIRTYRRCNRIMMFHCFDAPDLPQNPYLVSSLELFYDDQLLLKGNESKIDGFSFLVKARHSGHKWDPVTKHYTSKHLPDMDLTYQPHEWNTKIEKVSPENSVHAPVGIGNKQYLWIDLFSEGISGILTEQGDGWFYKSNLGDGNFTRAMPVATKPSLNGLSGGLASVQELEGNGIKYLVHYDNEPKGFFKLTDDDEWEPFRNFYATPNVNFADPNIRAIDLNGDGLSDLLVTEDNLMRWYPGAGEKGFEVSQTVIKEIDEEKGPAILFQDATQSIFLADMNGDGLTDIVRIRNGEVCYWPNLGYGHFGAKASMENAPLFDHTDAFNPSFLRLADIDGSGTIDLVYLGRNDFRVWMNLNGNEFTNDPQIISPFPQVNNLSDVSVLDFLGSGTACIVYSSSLPQDAQQPLQYIDLMGSKKPHLLVGYQNNCGKEVSLEYKPSTYYYLQDKKEGRKWITKLPFPVHCISTVRIEDKIRETVFTNSYSYRHGYFDHEEKEFRGFARVEQLDTEDFSQFKINIAKNVVDEKLHQPPVRTVSWFHTSAYLRNEKILHQCKHEYFKNTGFTEYDLPDAIIPAGLTTDELREAYRACKGLPLRVEVYANDDNPKSSFPYTASESTCEIKLIQPKGINKHASFLVLPGESISYNYDRNPADPRMSHSFVLETDELGNPTKMSSVVYARVRRPIAPNEIPDKVWEEQNKSHILYGESKFTDDIIEDDIYRLRAGYESKSYEIGGIAITRGSFIKNIDLKNKIDGAKEILFEEDFSTGVQKRLSSHNRAYFLKDDLSDSLPLGKLSNLGIGHNSYKLAFTKNLVPKYYGDKVKDGMLSISGYVHTEGDEHWWIPSGTAIFGTDPKKEFYTPIGIKDVFGNESFVEYDPYSLLMQSVTDALKNKVIATNDYRTLSPAMIIDPNLNRAAVETDELGMVTKTAIMGKEGVGEGDSLADPTTRMEYELFNWQKKGKPNYVHSFAREQHGASNLRWQEGYTYSDGGGNVIMVKAQAKPGKASKWNPVIQLVEEVDADPRWIGNGRTIFNNKGNAIKQYDPYFSTTPEYEGEDALVETGFTTILYYDAAGRNIRTEYPNGTFSKGEFDAWYLKAYDPNDTVKDSQWYLERKSPDPEVLPEPSDAETRAAWLAAKHYDTPGTIHIDSLGRQFYAIADFGKGKTTPIYSESDAVGRYTKAFDQLNRMVAKEYTNLAGAVIYSKTAEKGENWVFTDVIGRLVKGWDNNVREFRNTFDKLHRPISSFVKEKDKEILFAHIVYGDSFDDLDAVNRNMKGQVYKIFDQAGVVTINKIDFKGNATEVERVLAKEYKDAVDWTPLKDEKTIASIDASAAPFLEEEAFTSYLALDALNRPVTVILAEGSVFKPQYNVANFLDSLNVQVSGKGEFIPFLINQDYDAKGQRKFAEYGNGLITKYFYDAKTFRLINLVTKKKGEDDIQSLQNLFYTFDPVGNITYSKDDAQQKNYFKNTVVKPESKYEYDPMYQLLSATGRELDGLGSDMQRNSLDLPFINQIPHARDTNAVRNYTEKYQYDDCGNITLLQHFFGAASWKRQYHYEYQDDPANNTNRLKTTSLPGDTDIGPYSAHYDHDIHGNMTKLPHLEELVWDSFDQLKEVNLGGGGKAYYVYDVSGNRSRKIIERSGGKKLERIYLGSVEIYREYTANTKKLERSTLHISDDTGVIAQIDTKMVDTENADRTNLLNESLIRYQYTNHLGSATLETDKDGVVISYEEYHPYGTSAYRSSKSNVDVSLKRYRFSGKERDDETGFHYFGARYYAAWLARWVSSDPAGFVDGLNVYSYLGGNPVCFIDLNGTSSNNLNSTPHPIGGPQSLVNPITEYRIGGERENFAVTKDTIYEYDPTPSVNSGTAVKKGVPPKPIEEPKSLPPGPEPLLPLPEAPPPVSPSDERLHVGQDWINKQYYTGLDEMNNPDNPLWARATMGILAGLTYGAALGAEAIVGVENIPYILENSAIKTGEYIGQSYLWGKQGETGEAVLSGLHAVSSASEFTFTALSVAQPFVPEVGIGASGALGGVESETISAKNAGNSEGLWIGFARNREEADAFRLTERQINGTTLPGEDLLPPIKVSKPGKWGSIFHNAPLQHGRPLALLELKWNAVYREHYTYLPNQTVPGKLRTVTGPGQIFRSWSHYGTAQPFPIDPLEPLTHVPFLRSR